jgi:RNA polymerase sigma factor (sigma-70 family)
MTEQDQHYLKALQHGDKYGMEKIYRDFMPRIHSLITRNGGNDSDARDVFQDTMVVLFQKCRQDNFQLTSAFATLLYGVARNIWGNRLQKRSRSEVTLNDDLKSTVKEDLGDLILDEEKRRIFYDAFRKLGPDCQKLLELYFDKTSMQAIAQALGYASEGYAKKRKFQCKEQLIKFVRQDQRFYDYAFI